MAYPQPANVSPWYLRNITQALALDEVSGNVYIRTDAQIGNVTIQGDVNIPGNINASVYQLGNIDISGNTMPIGGNVGVTGNVNIGSLPEVEIKNDIGNAIPVTSNYNQFTVGFAPTQTDAFGRFRVSNPFTLFDSFHRFADNGKINSYSANGGTSTYDAAAGVVQINVTTAANSEVIRESSRVFAYQPGKSLLVLQTYCMGPAQDNLRIRQGYYDESNGFYIQRLSSQVSLVKRSSSSGSLVETVVNQSNWNVDPMDGTGPSGITLDFTKAQIMWHDLEWLGVGTVRVGFVVNGTFYPVHYWNHANIVTTSYMTTACLPVRAEIKATSALAATATHTIICTSIMSEGGYQLVGKTLSAGHALNAPITLPDDQTFKPIISMRLKTSRLNGIVLPTNFTIAPKSSSNFKYRLVIQGITSGGTWVDAGANSCVEYNLAPTTLVSGIDADVGFIIASNQTAASTSLATTPFAYQLERNSFTSTAYEFVIMAATTGTNQDIWGAIGWQEVT